MKTKGIVSEDFLNFKIPSMFIIMPTCSFKCDKESDVQCCQNSSLAKQPTIDISTNIIIENYLQNDITNAIVFGGLEPMDSFDEIETFIKTLRRDYQCFDYVVIYTGYNKSEILPLIEKLAPLANVIVKFGRFVPNQKSHFDKVLGIYLASDNQYAEIIC